MKKICLFLSICIASSLGFAATDAKPNKDSEIVAFIMVLNKNEIAAADTTKHKKVDKDVKKFSHLMLKEHHKNLNATQKLSKQEKIKPDNTEAVVALQNAGKEEVKSLKPLKDKAYEKAYIDAMVKDHTDALQSINNFIGEVQNPKLKAHLEKTRDHVQEHLTKAQEIQKTLS